MKIHFTKEEYKTLVDTLCIADWVLHAHNSSKEMPESTKVIRELEQKIYKLSDKFDCKDLFDEINAKDKIEYCPNKEVEDKNQKFIESFEEDSFWDELLDRLSKRDTLNSVTQKEREEMDVRKYWELKQPFEEKYEAEFNDCGIERLYIKK